MDAAATYCRPARLGQLLVVVLLCAAALGFGDPGKSDADCRKETLAAALGPDLRWIMAYPIEVNSPAERYPDIYKAILRLTKNAVETRLYAPKFSRREAIMDIYDRHLDRSMELHLAVSKLANSFEKRLRGKRTPFNAEENEFRLALMRLSYLLDPNRESASYNRRERYGASSLRKIRQLARGAEVPQVSGINAWIDLPNLELTHFLLGMHFEHFAGISMQSHLLVKKLHTRLDCTAELPATPDQGIPFERADILLINPNEPGVTAIKIRHGLKPFGDSQSDPKEIEASIKNLGKLKSYWDEITSPFYLKNRLILINKGGITDEAKAKLRAVGVTHLPVE